MAADLELGDNGILTTTLTANDRITITRAATGYEVASMTVGQFTNYCTGMMPLASTSGNGFMSAEKFNQTLRLRQNFYTGQELDLNTTAVGLYYVHSTYHGGGCLFLVSSYAGSVMIGGDSLHHYSGDLNDTGKICFGRKETNGNIYVKCNANGTLLTIERL